MIRSSFAYIATLTFIFLLPFFSIPFTGFDPDTSKVALLIAWGAIVLITSVITIVRERSWRNPLTITPIGSAAIVSFLVMVCSAVLSPIDRLSLFGDGYSIVVPLFFVAAMVVAYVVSQFARDNNRVSRIFLAVVGSAGLLVVVQFLMLVIRKLFGLPGVFEGYIFSMIGKWNDIGMLALMVGIASVVAIKRFALEGMSKWINYALLATSVIILMVVNLRYTWYAVLVLSAVVLFAYIKHRKSDHGLKQVYVWIIGAIALLSLIVMLDNSWQIAKGRISSFAATTFDVSIVEAYPSTESMLTVAKNVISNDPMFGFGPGRFVDMWRVYRPQDINLSQFWATDFAYGVGLWPTLFVSTGIIGTIVLAVLIGLILKLAYTVYSSRSQTSLIPSFIREITSLSVILYTLSFFVYAPGFGTALFYVVLVGLVLGQYAHLEKGVVARQVPFVSKHWALSLVVYVLIISTCVGTGYFYAKKVSAAYHFNNGIVTPVQKPEDLQIVSDSIIKAIQKDPRDAYVRTLANVWYTQFTSARVSTTSTYTAEQFQQMLDRVLQLSADAVRVNPYNAQNYIFNGELYRTLGLQGVEGATEQAQAFFKEAKKYDPYNPLIAVSEARIAAANEDEDMIITSLEEAIRLKPNYTEAVFLISQQLIANGDEDEAIKKLEARAGVGPVDPVVFFQLGFMKYSLKDYTGAIQALEPAVYYVPEYSNALYFLGLAYYQVDRVSDAVTAFQIVKQLNPENTEVQKILENLQAGKAPFASIPQTESPEKRDKPPVENDKAVEEEE